MDFTLNLANFTIAAHSVSASSLLLKEKKMKYFKAMGSRAGMEEIFLMKDALFTKVIKKYAYIYISI
jgi:hypothetical protein